MDILYIGGRRRSVSASIDPLDLSSLELYLRSDQVAGVDGAAVSSWPDLSAYSRTFVQTRAAGKPAVLASGSSNGTRLVRFDGRSDPNGDVMGSSFSLPGPTNGYSFYFYGIWYTTINANTGEALLFSQAGGRPNLVVDDDSSSKWGWGDTGGSHYDGTTPADGSTKVLSYVFTPPSGTGLGKAYFGTSTTPEVSAVWNFDSSVPTSWLLCDNNDPGVLACKVDLGAVVIFSTAHDEATRVGVAQFLIDFFEN